MDKGRDKKKVRAGEAGQGGRAFARPISDRDLRRRVQKDEFPEAAIFAALAIGQWIGVLGAEDAKRPEWAFDACVEFYVYSRLWRGILDPVRDRRPVDRSDLARLLRVLQRNTDWTDKKVVSLRRAIEEDLPRKTEEKHVNKTIRRITEKFGQLVGSNGEIPDDLYQLICRFEASRRGGKQLGD